MYIISHSIMGNILLHIAIVKTISCNPIKKVSNLKESEIYVFCIAYASTSDRTEAL